MSAGNKYINLLLLKSPRQVLRVELEDWEGNKAYAEYDEVKVEGRTNKYRLKSIGIYSGTAGGFDVQTLNTCIVGNSLCIHLLIIFTVGVWATKKQESCAIAKMTAQCAL